MSIEDDFWLFHRENPHVYTALVGLARGAKAQGASKLGMKQYIEVLRWQHSMRTQDWTGFKLNNNYTSYYSRLVMKEEDDLEGVFDTRALHAEEPFGHEPQEHPWRQPRDPQQGVWEQDSLLSDEPRSQSAYPD